MSYVHSQASLDLKPSGPKVSEETLRHDQRALQTAWGQCLIVSSKKERNRQLNEAATLGGWKTVICRRAEDATTAWQRHLIHFAVVDLFSISGDFSANDAESRALRCAGEQLSERRDLLLAICGRDGDAMQEIWARQLGAWLYLPGELTTDDLALVCGEAWQLSRQMARVEDNPIKKATESRSIRPNKSGPISLPLDAIARREIHRK